MLKNFLPKSNWERYFEGQVLYGAEKLKDEWQELYEIRNKIAHNRGIEKHEYDRLSNLSFQLNKILSNAITKLESGFIEVTEEQKHEIQSEIDTFKPSDAEDVFLKALDESQKWLDSNPNPNAFIGVNYFITSVLADKGLSEEEGRQILHLLKDRKIIDIYKHEDPAGLYLPASAIRKIEDI